MPLLEVVTEPDLRSGVEAAAYGAELRRIVTFLGISNGNMQVLTVAVHSELDVCDPTWVWNGIKIHFRNPDFELACLPC